MCWNAEVSLQSFLIGITAVFLGYQNGLSLPVTLFCLTIVFMQLIEYFVWTFSSNKTVNFVASLAAVGLLWLQPIASILTLESKETITGLQVYIGLSIIGLFLPNNKPLDQVYKMTQGENGHLVWNWFQKDNRTILSLLVYFVFLLGPLLLRKQFILFSLATSTLALSLYSFYKDNTWGSLWCWIVNYIVVGICGYQIVFSGK
jgi:hypothetical protein